MCRLYGHYSTHLETVNCDLLSSQNSLIKQSQEDMRGLSNPHGWGVGYLDGNHLTCKREPEPASGDKDFRQIVNNICTRLMIAHVRRATVGSPRIENTHPFLHEQSMLAHNGHIDSFHDIQKKMIQEISPEHRDYIYGSTDSEHIFHLLLTKQQTQPDQSPVKTIRNVIRQIEAWTDEVKPHVEPALNFLWVYDNQLFGTRYNRSLYYLERDQAHRCGQCGHSHVEDPDPQNYYSVEIASEPITDEEWQNIDNYSVFAVTPDREITIESL